MAEENGLSLDRRGEIDFAKPLARALLRDGRISFAARGLFAFLWDLPSNWRPRPSHLAKMSGAGKDALMRLRRELEAVGAVAVEAVRLTAEEVIKKNEADPDRRHPYRAGQVVGSRWVLFAPHLWAVEMPLDGDTNSMKTCTKRTCHRETGKPTLGLSDCRKDRQPENPPLRFCEAKGSPKKEVARAPARLAQDAAAAGAKRRRGDEDVRHGVEVWTVADGAGLEKLVERHGARAVEEVAASLQPAPGHRAPYVSQVQAGIAKREEAEKSARAVAEREVRRAASAAAAAAGVAPPPDSPNGKRLARARDAAARSA